MLRSKVHLSTLVLATIGAIDLVSTMALMHVGIAEGNPLFAEIAHFGSLSFAGAKVILLAGPILLLECVRKVNPQSAEQGTWVAAAFYALIYVGHLTL